MFKLFKFHLHACTWFVLAFGKAWPRDNTMLRDFKQDFAPLKMTFSPPLPNFGKTINYIQVKQSWHLRMGGGADFCLVGCGFSVYLFVCACFLCLFVSIIIFFLLGKIL